MGPTSRLVLPQKLHVVTLRPLKPVPSPPEGPPGPEPPPEFPPEFPPELPPEFPPEFPPEPDEKSEPSRLLRPDPPAFCRFGCEREDLGCELEFIFGVFQLRYLIMPRNSTWSMKLKHD